MTLPKSPANFVGILSYAGIVGLAATIATVTRLQSVFAVAWIEPIDHRSFSLRAEGRTQFVRLAPGDVQAFTWSCSREPALPEWRRRAS